MISPTLGLGTKCADDWLAGGVTAGAGRTGGFGLATAAVVLGGSTGALQGTGTKAEALSRSIFPLYGKRTGVLKKPPT